MRRRKAETLLEVAVARVGLVKGTKVLLFMICWDTAQQALGGGDAIDVEEYADWWRMSRSQAFREQALFRRAFPTELTPERLMALIRASESFREVERAKAERRNRRALERDAARIGSAQWSA